MDSFKQIGLLRNSAKYSHDSHNDIYHAICIIHISSVVSTSVDETCIVCYHVLSKHIEASKRTQHIPTLIRATTMYMTSFGFVRSCCRVVAVRFGHLLHNVARCSQDSQAKSKLPKKSLIANAPFWTVTSSSHTLIHIVSRCLQPETIRNIAKCGVAFEIPLKLSLFIAIREMIKNY